MTDPHPPPTPSAPRASGRAHLSTARTRLLTVEPAPDAHRVAIRAATIMVIALVSLTAMDQLHLAAYATFGAFASVYGGRVPTTRRWRTQTVMAGVLVIVVVAALQGVAELLVSRHYGAALVFITPLALLVGQLAFAQPVGRLLEGRLLETLIGVGVGLVTAVVTRDRHRGR